VRSLQLACDVITACVLLLQHVGARQHRRSQACAPEPRLHHLLSAPLTVKVLLDSPFHAGLLAGPRLWAHHVWAPLPKRAQLLVTSTSLTPLTPR
jgi:hypothetical protein